MQVVDQQIAPPAPSVSVQLYDGVSEPDGSDEESSEDSTPEIREIVRESDGTSEEDYMTDDGEEKEAEHGEEQLSWTQSVVWQKEAENDEFIRECGEAKWTAPAKREDVPSIDTGPEQDCAFDVDVERSSISLLLDALPISFWKRVARQSLRFAASKGAFRANSRYCKREWFTVGNYVRVFAAVLMRGLVSARDDVEFFQGATHGKYQQTGAEEVIGLTLNKYQQLLRYMHLVDNARKLSSQHKQFDKCFAVRPLIKLLQQAFIRWVVPGKNNAMDEAGIPSRHRWLRTYNPSKPNKYFMEILMACDSTTRFCWSFFVTESAKKVIKNRHRAGRTKSKFKKVTHYQHEYGPREREIQDRFGSAPAQMVYFARMLRENYDSPHVTYRLFTDRRWDSIPGIVVAKKEFNVSYTATVNKKSRYHIITHWCKKGAPIVPKSKKRNKRGKYRSATTTIQNVILNECLWNDSNLLGGVSADLGCENRPVVRRMGRHKPLISCPYMMFVRGKHLRGVDIHDQLRACKWRIVFVCKGKAWPKLTFGLFEILLVNIYVVKQQCRVKVKPDEFRWNLVTAMVDKADALDADRARAASNETVPQQSVSPDVVDEVGRFQGVERHHHELLLEYVDPELAKFNQLLADENPTRRPLSRRPRQRDRNRKDGKVRNPLWTSASVCLVCKYQHGIRKETNRYCRECCVELFSNWPRTNRATGFAKDFHPRLCSKKCFDFFHTHTIKGLDYSRKRQREGKNRNSASRKSRVSANRATVTPPPIISTPVLGTGRVRDISNTSRTRNSRFNV